MAPTDTTLVRINPGLGPAIDGVEYNGAIYWRKDEPHRVPSAAVETRDVNTLPIFVAVEDASEYGDLTVTDLRKELADRGVVASAGARKADLVAALEEHDQAAAEPDRETLPITPSEPAGGDEPED